MATYQFVARDSAGRLQRGLESAVAPSAVVADLRERGWSVVDVRESADSMTGDLSFLSTSLSSLRPKNWFPPTSLDVQLSLSQLAVMIRGGMTLLSAMHTAGEQARRVRMRRTWEDV